MMTFEDLKIGTQFKFYQAESATYTKWSPNQAKKAGRTPFFVDPTRKVVEITPEAK